MLLLIYFMQLQVTNTAWLFYAFDCIHIVSVHSIDNQSIINVQLIKDTGAITFGSGYFFPLPWSWG